MGKKPFKILVALILIAGFSFQSIASVCQMARCGDQPIMDCCKKTEGDKISQYRESCCSMKNSESPLPFSPATVMSSSDTFQIRNIQTAPITLLPNFDLSAPLSDLQSPSGKPSEFRTPILRI